MVLSIKSLEADRLARELTRETGESITAVVIDALKERLERVHNFNTLEARLVSLKTVSEYYKNLPTLDARAADDILGYDHQGLPS